MPKVLSIKSIVNNIRIDADANNTLYHPNKLPFSGILTRLDQPSDKAPSGSKGKKVFIPRYVAENRLDTLYDTAVDITYNLQGHDSRTKIGIITRAEIQNDAIYVYGHLFAHDFPDEIKEIRALSRQGKLGMSFEITSVMVQDPDADILIIEDLVFTGAAILLKDSAAYSSTRLAASLSGKDTILSGKLKELKASLVQIAEEIDAQSNESTDADTDVDIKALKQQIDSISSKISASKESDNKSDDKSDVKSLIQTLEDIKTKIDASEGDQQAAKTGFKSEKSMMRSLMNDAVESMIKRGMKNGTDAEDDDDESGGYLVKMLKQMLMGEGKETETKNEGGAMDSKLESQLAKLVEKIDSLEARFDDINKKEEASAKEDDVAAKEEEKKEEEKVTSEIEAANKQKTPERKTKPVNLSVFASKYGIDPEKEDGYSVTDIDEIISKSGINATQGIAMKLELQQAGLIK